MANALIAHASGKAANEAYATFARQVAQLRTFVDGLLALYAAGPVPRSRVFNDRRQLAHMRTQLTLNASVVGLVSEARRVEGDTDASYDPVTAWSTIVEPLVRQYIDSTTSPTVFPNDLLQNAVSVATNETGIEEKTFSVAQINGAGIPTMLSAIAAEILVV